MGCVASRSAEPSALKAKQLQDKPVARSSWRFPWPWAGGGGKARRGARGADDEADAAELAREIAARAASAVHARVTRFEQLHARSQCDPPLRSLTVVTQGDKTGAAVALFEALEIAARVAPPLAIVAGPRPPRDGKFLERVRSFEDMERRRRDEERCSLAALKAALPPPKRGWEGSKVPVEAYAYSL